MYPIVEQYIAARKKADDDYDAVSRALRGELDKVRYSRDAHMQTQPLYLTTSSSSPGWLMNTFSPPPRPDPVTEAREVYYAGLNKADEVRRQAHKAAWELLSTSDDPLVRYVYAHCHSYPDHARQILEILPADFAAMQEVARKGNWCEVFDGFAAGAVRQKLIKDERTPQRRKLEKFLTNDSGIYSDARRHILTLVDAEVAAAVKRALAAERRAVRETKAKTVPKAPKVAAPQAVTA